MMTAREVILDGGSPWGFRMHGGVDTGQPLKISRVNPGSKAASRGVREGDLITSINSKPTTNITNAEAHSYLKNAGDILKLGLNQDSNGTPKRKQYRTVHQETTHEETIKRSSVTTVSIKSSKKVESLGSSSDSTITKEEEDIGKSKKCGSSKSLSSTSSESTATLTEDAVFRTENCALSCSNSSSPGFDQDYGTAINIPNMADTSKSKKRRNRRKNKTKSCVCIEEALDPPVEAVKIDYRVESPETVKLEAVQNGVVKSRSLDDDMVKIKEMSDASEAEENQAIVSEADSELEEELISPEEELNLRNFLEGLNLPKASDQKDQDLASSRKAKRAALEQYFLPMMNNPRFLDVISEEASDQSDREMLSHSMKQCSPDQELVVQTDTVQKVEAETVFVESSDSEDEVKVEDVLENQLTPPPTPQASPQSTACTNCVSPLEVLYSRSSSSEDSLSTAKFTPGEAIAEVAILAKEEEEKRILEKNLFQVSSLREIVLKFLMSLPYGEEMLQELADVSKSIDSFTKDLPGKVLSKFACNYLKSPEMGENTDRPRLLDVIREESEMRFEEEEFRGRSSLVRDKFCLGEARSRAKDLSEWLRLARHKSLGNVCILDARNNRDAENNRRASLPPELLESQLQHILEKEREIQIELERLEEEKRFLSGMVPTRFSTDDYRISRKGDYAVRDERKRPVSMPALPCEVFRQQMYEEYMNEVLERQERRQHKVIKVSSSKQNLHQVTPKEIQDEFMEKVKMKHGDVAGESLQDEAKVEENEEEPPVLVIDGDELKEAKELPKHLKEFVDIAKHPEEEISENLPVTGVWSPGQRQEGGPPQPPPPVPKSILKDPSKNKENEPIPLVWTPKSASSSPIVERKEFRPVNFQSPVLSRRNKGKEEGPDTPSSTTSEPPWKHQDNSDVGTSLSSTLEKRLPTSHSSPASGFSDFSPRLPKAQNPTITLLQKAREGQIPKGPVYIEDSQQRRKLHERPGGYSPGEVVYQVKHEYTSESDTERPRKMADLGPRKFEGIGPVTKDGMPLILRSEVRDTNQSKWYKKMYDTIHKQKPHRDEYVTVRYKTKRVYWPPPKKYSAPIKPAQYPYVSGYLSEPEPGAYDSDYADYKYATLDRRNLPVRSDYTYTMPRNQPYKSSSSTDIIRNSQDALAVRPGRIENYRPGHSSISDKEAKAWWDEVMDIFDGWLDDNSALPSYDYMFARALARSHLEQVKKAPQQQKSFINQALKDSGYNSDSTLVFHKKNISPQLSPSEQKEAYKEIQKGGDIPTFGLRKLAPERPKDGAEEIVPQTEYLCYPVMIQETFGKAKRNAPSASSIPKPPPFPPKRKSSRNSSTLKLISTMKVKEVPKKRHETCFTPPDGDKNKVKYLKDKITCKLTPSTKNQTQKIKVYKSVTTSPDLKKVTSSITTKSTKTKVQSKTVTRSKSESRKIFGTEKKKAKVTKQSDLLSPTEVKKVMTPFGAVYKKSVAVLASAKNNTSIGKKDTIPIKVGMSEKARSILKSPQMKRSSVKLDVEKKLDDDFSSRLALEEIRKQREAVQTNYFFQHLFLRDSSPTGSSNSWVNERTQQLFRRRASFEPSVGAMQIYLQHTKPVSESRFRSLDFDLARSRSVSPKMVTWSDRNRRSVSLPSKIILTQTSRPISPSPVRKNKPPPRPPSPMKRSSSEKMFFSQTVRPVSPIVERVVYSPKLTRASPKKLVFTETSRPVSPQLKKTRMSRLSRSASERSVRKTDQKMVFSETSRPVSPVVQKSKLKRSSSAKSIIDLKKDQKDSKRVVLTETSRPVSPAVERRNFVPSSARSSPTKMFFTETSRPISPCVSRKSLVSPKMFLSETSRSLSPREIVRSPSPARTVTRSPSSRRIMQMKTAGELAKRSKSLENKVPQTLYLCQNFCQSSSSLDSSSSREYQGYIKELIQSSKKSGKFKDLNLFYSDIEKVGQLEEVFNVKPRKKSECEIIDYDRWKEVRTRERAEEELNQLYKQLKENEKEKGFLFMPKDVTRFKWKKEYDRGLRIKEKSVDNIKEEFERLKEERARKENAVKLELAYKKGIYKPLWRGNSVLNLAKEMVNKRSQSEERSPFKNIDTEKLLNYGVGKKVWSSLSTEQINSLKNQLCEIYSQNFPNSNRANDFSIEVPKNFKADNSLTVRRNSDSSEHSFREKPKPLDESEKKLLSQSLSKELMDRFAKRNLVLAKETMGAIAQAKEKSKESKNLENIKKLPQPLIKTNAITTPISCSETDSTDDSARTAIFLGEKEGIQKKVEYFEHRNELEPYTPTIYKPADDSSNDNDSEVKGISRSSSCQNMKEYFGENEMMKFATIPLSATRKEKFLPSPPNLRTVTLENENFFRTRSLSPEPKALIKSGEVQRLMKKFEYLLKTSRRSKSESDLSSLRNLNIGHVEDLKRKYELPFGGRGRSRFRKGGVISPVFLKDRLMPHINIISKIASLYNKKRPYRSRSLENLSEIFGCRKGEVEKLKEKFSPKEISLMGHVFTSSPDVKELKDIAPYLAGSWTAHRYPKMEDNTRSLSSPDGSKSCRDTSSVLRKKSSSRKQGASDQRYNQSWTQTRPVSFKEPEPPVPPPKGQHLSRNADEESPRKYVENEVTIHYKTPVRQEVKEYLSEDELAHRQAEAMKKIYQEERRRKYLQELQDINNRRHTDNFTPSQKSPIPLNRYDDFDVVAPSKQRPRSPEPRLIAKALYNFVGQTARELTFRKGDLIYVRKQVDKNWYEGELNAMIGLFPANYVEIVPYDTSKSTPRKSYEGQARAKFNFFAQTELELSLAKGELVTITRRVDDNWFEGKIGGRKGIFPVSYVDVLIDPSTPPPASAKPVAAPAAHSLLLNGSAGGKESMGSHLYTPNIGNPTANSNSYHAKPVQLSGAGTYASLNRSSGKNALNEALHIETQSEPVPYRALYKYNPQNDDELELLEGDIVHVLEKCDDGWYVGSSERTGAFGTFPGNYVEKLN